MSKPFSLLLAGAFAVACVVPSVAAPGVALAQEHVAPEHAAPAGETAASEHATAAAEHGAAEHGAAEHGAAEHGAHHGPGPINWLDFGNKEQPPYAALFINFAILALIYWKYGKKPVADGLKKRREDLMKEIEEAQRIQHEAEERAKVYQAKIANLEQELAEAKNAIVTAGKGERDRIILESTEKAARLQRDVEFRTQQEMKELRHEIQREAVEMAINAAADLLKTRVTSDDQQRLADAYLDDVTKMVTNRSAGGAE